MFGMDMMLKNMGLDLSEIPTMIKQAREMGGQLGLILTDFRERLARIEDNQRHILELLEKQHDGIDTRNESEKDFGYVIGVTTEDGDETETESANR